MITKQITIKPYVNLINSDLNRRYVNNRGLELRFTNSPYVATRVSIRTKKFGFIPWKITVGHFYTISEGLYILNFEPGYEPLYDDLYSLIGEAVEFADNFLEKAEIESDVLKSIEQNKVAINLKEYFKNEL